MSKQNLDGFKPLSEEEESHIVGGASPTNTCAPYLKIINELKAELAQTKQGSQAYQALEAKINTAQENYDRCMKSNS